MPYYDNALSIYIAAYIVHYCTHYILIRLIEGLRWKLDNDGIVALPRDLSRTFDSTRHDLLIARLAAYGFYENSLAFIYLYLK